MTESHDIIRFWFEEIQPKRWFTADADFDSKVKARFTEIHAQASRGELYLWRGEKLGRLAEIIILDQFSRTIMRGAPAAFAADSAALILAQEAYGSGAAAGLSDHQRMFLTMPYMHAESRIIQRESLRLFESLALAEAADAARQHADIIEQFGRFPHRNQILGRVSTQEEQEFLQTHSGF